jgi:hypothetical protein
MREIIQPIQLTYPAEENRFSVSHMRHQAFGQAIRNYLPALQMVSKAVLIAASDIARFVCRAQAGKASFPPVRI